MVIFNNNVLKIICKITTCLAFFYATEIAKTNIILETVKIQRTETFCNENVSSCEVGGVKLSTEGNAVTIEDNQDLG